MPEPLNLIKYIESRIVELVPFGFCSYCSSLDFQGHALALRVNVAQHSQFYSHNVSLFIVAGTQ